MTRIKEFIKTHGSGFWLHTLAAVVIMIVGAEMNKVLPYKIELFGYVFSYVLMTFIFNLIFWPIRELWQKRHALMRFFTFHVFLEWIPAVVVSFVFWLLYAVMR